MNAKTIPAYEQDFYKWALHSAAQLRAGKLTEVDIENVAEELESMGRRDKRELLSRLAVLIAHLLKWNLQPARRSKSWKYTIKEQRIRIIKLLEESPSLKTKIKAGINEAYEEAIVIAISETGLDEKDFSKGCPFTLANCLDHDFFPEDFNNPV